MNLQNRPYIIVPKLIVQPTWGGEYISKLKDWDKSDFLKDKKIGQSYELFSQSKLLINIMDSSSVIFIPELGNPDTVEIDNKNIYKENIDYISLSQVTDLTNKIPLIKITQSNGNSFQIHIKEGMADSRWQPKMESWYYFEDGLATLGLKKGINIDDYKNACLKIDEKMKSLSNKILNKQMNLDEAKEIAKEFIKTINPWQFINVLEIKKNQIMDSGNGGIHHSWEEDLIKFPNGNVLYEVQQDVMDPVSTIRAFDKGKFKSDGSIRELHIEDYFKYLDISDENNYIEKMFPKKQGSNLITKKYYKLDLLEVADELTKKIEGSFIHLFVKSGKVTISAGEGEVILTRGHSCFISEKIDTYKIRSISEKSELLKTFV